MKERDIEAYLVKRVKELGGEVRKVVWPGRKSAPDRLVMLPSRVLPEWGGEVGPGAVCASTGWYVPARILWIELKAPGLKATFPADAHERAQNREHIKMRKCGQTVLVIDSKEEIDEVLR